LHGSGAEQSDTPQRQSPHDPEEGPDDVPVTQLQVVEHHPQPGAAAHVPQSECTSHGSGSEHSEVPQRQSPHHPSVGPDVVPVMQLHDVSHHPQDGCDAQVPQSSCTLHGSVSAH
jgi:hypothetical protein